MITGKWIFSFQFQAAAPMRNSAFCFPAALILQALLAALFLCPVGAGEVEQRVNLDYGWNAVWLEVEPRGADGETLTADQVFKSQEGDDFVVDRVASRIRFVGTAEFTTDLNSTFNQDGWDVWALDPASGETGNIAVQGNHAYLVHVAPNTGVAAQDGDPAGGLNLQGEVEFYQPAWSKGSLNLVGFAVQGTPTFTSLLAGSGIVVDGTLGANPNVQKLNSATGNWEAVKGTDPVESGRSYWIDVPYKLPGNGWVGPVETDFPGAITGSLNFGSGPGSLAVVDPADPAGTVLMSSAELTFSSREGDGGSDHQVTVSRLLPEAADNELQFFALEPVPLALQWAVQLADFSPDPGPGWQAAELSPGTSQSVTVGVRRNWTTGTNIREHLYKVSVALNGGAVYRYLPVTATNANLPADSSDTPPAGEFTGFWAGQVTLVAVTSLGTPGAPLQPASSQLPLRILIHVDAAGQASLVSRALLMQTKTASDDIPPEPVLVLDETRIPFYEGIQERADGTRVALRFESANFDMPRALSAASLSAELRSKVEEAKLPDDAPVTDEDVATYFSLTTRDSRPPDLPETYYLSWPLGGQLGVGHTLATSSPLTLDPFHRSNPFRHAFHPRHGKGYAVTRSFSISFGTAPGPGILVGTYQETTSGLTRQDIVSKGSIALRRVSAAAAVE